MKIFSAKCSFPIDPRKFSPSKISRYTVERKRDRQRGKREKQSIHTCFLDPESSPVVDGVLLVVDGSIVPDEVEVFLEVVKSVVLVCLQFLLHGRKIHRVLDDIKVVRHLEEGEWGEWLASVDSPNNTSLVGIKFTCPNHSHLSVSLADYHNSTMAALLVNTPNYLTEVYHIRLFLAVGR